MGVHSALIVIEVLGTTRELQGRFKKFHKFDSQDPIGTGISKTNFLMKPPPLKRCHDTNEYRKYLYSLNKPKIYFEIISFVRLFNPS